MSGCADGILRVRDVDSGQCPRVPDGHTAEVAALVILSNGRFVVSLGMDVTVQVWELDWEHTFGWTGPDGISARRVPGPRNRLPPCRFG